MLKSYCMNEGIHKSSAGKPSKDRPPLRIIFDLLYNEEQLTAFKGQRPKNQSPLQNTGQASE